MVKVLFVLGSPDPEMVEIEKFLNHCNIPFAYAIGPDGQRVHPGNMYKATDCRWPSSNDTGPAWGSVSHMVECRPIPEACLQEGVVFIDHHRPGDFGFGRPPEEFLVASSIGQVISHVCRSGLHPEYLTEEPEPSEGRFVLEPEGFYSCEMPMDYFIRVPEEIVLAAAADHCLGAAYRGECPGVDPVNLLCWRLNTKAQFRFETVCPVCGGNGYSTGDETPGQCHGHMTLGECRIDLVKDIDDARRYLANRPQDEFGIVDCREQFVPELPEAAMSMEVAYVATVADRDGRVKDVLGGNTTPEIVAGWIDRMKAAGRETYGDPQRGFAGAYHS